MNLTEEAQGLLPYQFSQSLKLHGLVESLVRPFQEIEQLIEKMHHGCYISKAYGAQLDTLGDIVGMKRMGMDDEHYRAWISVSIKLNLCSGTTEEIFEIIGIMLENQKDFLMHEYPTQTLVFTFFSKPKVPLQSFFQIIKSAVALGSEALFVHAQKNSFQFDVTPFSKSQFAEFLRRQYESTSQSSPKKVDWALDKEANIQKPPSAIQQKGWQHEDIPTASNFNWIIHQLSKWDDYLDTEMRYHSAYVDGFRNSVDQDIAKIRKYLKTITQVLSALTIRVSKEHPHPQMILEKCPT